MSVASTSFLVNRFIGALQLAPVIVHCSAGIGRTGVLIMMETAMGLIEEGQPVRPQQLLQVMREQRPSLVQTEVRLSATRAAYNLLGISHIYYNHFGVRACAQVNT